ncbi:G-protein coupled receptor Mth isoform X2 [Drosophila mojavensis]|uniref:Uncharacterized protein, isoform D n=1 Tax=Drosophila mojavensis TaxID=7230 RepID=A0A0Q9XGN7_DROMO|nr:G-protein coupled receptor Mth isoform X2 [Drosophila mojavensis]KRG07648.1 uncharacterized protein Dmoj_GI16743, isoform D [Drosophila mojavensis]
MRLMGLLIMLATAGIAAAEIPGCDYFDTVDLSQSERLPNGSYQYEKLIIPASLVGEYDYEILEKGHRESVARHLRGCACHLGTCIRFCCHRNLFLVDGERKCDGDTSKAIEFDPIINITLNDGTQVRRHVLRDFIIQQDLPVPCASHLYLDAENDESHQWTLFENGVLRRQFDDAELSKQAYCLQPHKIGTEDSDEQYTLVPHNCAIEPPSQWLINTLRMISIVCLFLTICVYLYLPKLRNLHGLCFTCYMICLMMSFALLLGDSWKEGWSKSLCQVNGYLGYFFVMASFLWLTVISYDLWKSFRTNSWHVPRHTFNYRFLLYSLYAWGVATLLTIIVIIVDMSWDGEDEEQLLWIPGVAVYNCWVKAHDWSAALYFHGPMALQIIFNIVMFVLTSIRILKVQKELKDVAVRGEPQQRLDSNKRTYTLFVRLFVIMGVTWTFEIVVYLVQNNGPVFSVLQVFDYINSAQGVIIFIMFVLKRSVLKLISNRRRNADQFNRHTSISMGHSSKLGSAVPSAHKQL